MSKVKKHPAEKIVEKAKPHSNQENPQSENATQRVDNIAQKL